MGKRENFTAGRVAEFSCPADKQQAIYWDGKQPGLGLRVTAKGARAYVFQAWIDGGSVRVTIGHSDVWPLETIWTTDRETGQRVEVRRGARQEAARLKALVDSGVNPAEHRREQEAEKTRRKTAAESLKEKTVAALCTAYVELLKQRKKLDARDAESTLQRFLAANEDLAAKPAHAATSADFVTGLRKLHEAGKVREPGKVRSYAHAAFRTAMMARTDPEIPVKFEAFHVTANPLATIRATAARADKRPLSADELRTFWRIAQAAGGATGALMQLHILTGGQRIAQLLRLQRENVHADYIVLHDPKGRRPEARRHVVPLLADAKTALKAFTGAPGVFTVNGKAISPAVLARLEAEAIGDQIEAFEPKRLRSGIETALASLGVGREIRAQLQSHGLGGVQDRHYDDHDYLAEKRAALQVLLDLLNRKRSAKVTPIRGAAA
ncbi:integrase family protein [Thiomonas sp. FB-6]|uniref:integrase family protein n=1 Tax=Thiomonas sp. FB-6 TaxID=1158291 RepID=UPI000375B4A0|nr:integrase family protein [Thiomonas sp. FB-6]